MVFFYRRKKNSQNWKVYETTPVSDNYLVIKYLSGSRCENTVMNSSLFLLSRNSSLFLLSQSRREDNQAVKYRTSRPLITAFITVPRNGPGFTEGIREIILWEGHLFCIGLAT